MTAEIDIRVSLPDDLADVETLYRDAFPDEDLVPLVVKLYGNDVPALRLVATADNAIVGHVVFTLAKLAGQSARVALLGPLAVSTAHQRAGIGRKLVETGFERLASDDVSHVLVLGDPAYYERLGFRSGCAVAPPYSLPDEWRDAWQWHDISGDEIAPSGQLVLPNVWLDPKFWGP
jgi:putative acetyltransferase